MNKNSIVALLEKEIAELQDILQNISAAGDVPPVLFRLSRSKIENMGNLLELVESLSATENPAQKTIPAEEKIPEEIPVPEKNEPRPEIIIESEKNQEEIPEEKIQEKPEEEKPEIPEIPEIPSETPQPVAERRGSLSDVLAQQHAPTRVDSAMSAKKIDNLRQAISVVDKFRYQRELFGGDVQKMNETLDRLNAAPSAHEASLVVAALGWSDDNATAKEFMEILKRKFTE